MEKYYDTDGMDAYLLLKETGYCMSFETKMLQNNELSHILPFSVLVIDGEAIPCYSVNGMIELEVLEEKNNLTAMLVIQLFQELCFVTDQMGRYLLSPNNLILMEDYIFYDRIKKHFYFVYLPGYQISIREQMKKLLDQIINKMDHTDRENSALVYDIYQNIVNNDYDIRVVKHLFQAEGPEERLCSDRSEEQTDDNIENKGSHTGEYKDDWSSEEKPITQDRESGAIKVYRSIVIAIIIFTVLFGVGYVMFQYRSYGYIGSAGTLFGICILLAAELFVYMEMDRQNAVNIENEKKEVQNSNHMMEAGQMAEEPKADTPVDADTSVLSSANLSCVLMPVCEKESESLSPVIYLDASPKLIGRGKMADIRIADASVSKIHSRICFMNYEYMLEDMKSTNGTYVNGCLLPAETPVRIIPGDIIGFGCVQYRFCVQ